MFNVQGKRKQNQMFELLSKQSSFMSFFTQTKHFKRLFVKKAQFLSLENCKKCFFLYYVHRIYRSMIRSNWVFFLLNFSLWNTLRFYKLQFFFPHEGNKTVPCTEPLLSSKWAKGTKYMPAVQERTVRFLFFLKFLSQETCHLSGGFLNLLLSFPL